MYIDNEDFEKWMQKLSKKLNDIGADLKSLINTKEVFEPDEKLLDNQDLAFLLKVSYRTLQRYRTSGKLPYFMIGHKTYYRTNDVRSLCANIWISRHSNTSKAHSKGLFPVNDSAFSI